MSPKTLSGRQPTLRVVQKQLEHWRQNRQQRGPIPPELWENAVQLARKHSIYQVAKRLRLNAGDLKKRVEALLSKDGHGNVDGASAFIELDVKEAMTLNTEWGVELEDRLGSKVRMTYRGGKELDPAELAEAFWRKDK